MRIGLPVLLIFAFVSQASAQTRCECEYDDWVDDCDAEFERKGDWMLFKSNTEQCSRIDWYTDSQPRLTIVEDGKETVNLVGVPANAQISIASCKVCKDRMYSQKVDTGRGSDTGGNSPSAFGGESRDGATTVADSMYDYITACSGAPLKKSRDEFVAGLLADPEIPSDWNGIKALVRGWLSKDLDALARYERARNNSLKAIREFDVQIDRAVGLGQQFEAQLRDARSRGAGSNKIAEYQAAIDEANSILAILRSDKSKRQDQLEKTNGSIDYLVKSRDRNQCLLRQIG